MRTKLYFWPVQTQKNLSNKNALLLVTVAALGYFVDIYDLVLFNVVKKESLQQIMVGASAEEIKHTGTYLFNMQ